MSERSDLGDTAYETLDVEVGGRADRVATVAVSRPEARNALDSRARRELKDAVAAAESDDDVRVLVLTGAEGTGTFVAGADVSEFRDRGMVEQRAVSERPRVYETVDGADLPTIARINGHALGGGMELALACDVRIAATDAKLGQPEIGLGIMPGGGATQRLPRLIGEGQAMRLILSGEVIDAEEAADIGLVDGVPDDLDSRVYELAGKMAEKSPLALERAKSAVRAASRTGLDQGIEYEAELFVQLFATADKDEGIDAFLDGREPEFEGR